MRDEKWETMFRSDGQKWATPIALFKALDEEFSFRLDAAASSENAKVDTFISEKEDALGVPWHEVTRGPVWLNPPYGRGIGKWVSKALEESRKGLTVVVLVFSRTDTKWWHEFAMKATEIRFIRGRITFGGASNSAPAPSCILVFRPHGQYFAGMPIVSSVELPRK